MDRELWERAVKFHGHRCPGLAIGFKACEAAKEKMGLEFSPDEQIVCVTENDACGVDAVQALLSCTFGKGNLIYRGTGKQALSFFERKSGKKMRLVLKQFAGEMSRPERQKKILEAPVDEVFIVGTPSFELPETARIFKTVICESCGEGAPEPKIRLQEGKKVCLDCFRSYSRGWQ